LLGEAVGPRRMDLLDVRMDLQLPLIGVGAPSAIFMPAVAETLGTRLVVPENAEVANAVGAVTGNVVETAKISLRLDGAVGGVIYFSPWERLRFKFLDEAMAYAQEDGRRRLEAVARQNGAASVEISVREKQIEHLGVNYYMTATGSPWLEESGN
jgi:N-methylhydantoinase A/oxoprolinase/acetone carboxylase beta subunit